MFTWQKTLPYILLVGSFVGLIASFTLTHEKLLTLKDASYVPSCNLNPIITCGSVMSKSQAEVFGVPNTIFGLIAFSMLFAFAVLMLSGAVFTRAIWLAAQAAATLGALAVHYLIFESAFRIHAICPWCLAVWLVVIPVFWGITVRNISHQAFGKPQGVTLTVFNAILRNSGFMLAMWYLVLFGVLLVQFWDYWSTLL